MKLFPDWSSTRIIPAIDLRGGRCVRLVRGKREAEIHYDDDPLRVARRWQEAGAECLHVIDLGAAFGEPDSVSVVLEIAAAVDLPMQTGGGIRDDERVARLLDGGVARVILGTRAFRDPAFLADMVARHGRERIVVALDCEGEQVQVSGWEESALDIDGGLALIRRSGARHLLVTATDRDGTLSGPRLDLYERLLREEGLRVVAAGGIGELAHVRALLELRHPALEGIVVGRALYEGTVDLAGAIALAREIS
jgi:phosphoribosylformimino-5-aminoimidazole carboxamide ribotide isomerase